MIAAIKNGEETKVRELIDLNEELLTYKYDRVGVSVSEEILSFDA